MLMRTKQRMCLYIAESLSDPPGWWRQSWLTPSSVGCCLHLVLFTWLIFFFFFPQQRRDGEIFIDQKSILHCFRGPISKVLKHCSPYYPNTTTSVAIAFKKKKPQQDQNRNNNLRNLIFKWNEEKKKGTIEGEKKKNKKCARGIRR